MDIIFKAFGYAQTNCYIVKIDGKEIIIDPGMGAADYIIANCKNPVAILNTHGHFDHIWSNSELKEKLNIPIYCPRDDEFMLRAEQFGTQVPPSNADVLVGPNQTVDIGGISAKFHHFAGHTPGCSMIEIDNTFFSGDFIFKNSIGRTDFPYSNSDDMIKSLQKLSLFDKDGVVYPGHGEKTTIFGEQKGIAFWIKMLA